MQETYIEPISVVDPSDPINECLVKVLDRYHYTVLGYVGNYLTRMRKYVFYILLDEVPNNPGYYVLEKATTYIPKHLKLEIVEAKTTLKGTWRLAEREDFVRFKVDFPIET